MSQVHYTTDPGLEPDLAKLPWISSAPNGRFKAILNFYGAMPWGKKRLTGARVFSNQFPHHPDPVVLWITRASGRSTTLKIRGQRLDAPGSYASTGNTGSGGNNGMYGSLLLPPTAGCWRLTLTSGSVTGRFVFLTID